MDGVIMTSIDLYDEGMMMMMVVVVGVVGFVTKVLACAMRQIVLVAPDEVAAKQWFAVISNCLVDELSVALDSPVTPTQVGRLE
jgi:hypothetical protein